ncbi:PepSY-associated TM helix domain-containing protein [Algoriphagus sp.]
MNFLVYEIHFGSALGLPGRIFAFLASLIAASLPITGFLVWLNKRKKK